MILPTRGMSTMETPNVEEFTVGAGFPDRELVRSELLRATRLLDTAPDIAFDRYELSMHAYFHRSLRRSV